MLVLCVIGLLRKKRWARELAYFWGLAGSIHGLLTPDLQADFPEWKFFQFFWGHGGVILAVVFLLGVLRFRPESGGVWRAFLAINLYALIVGSLDAAFGWNYGYLCRVAGHPSLLDHLGPMPWRLFAMEGIALASFSLLTLPWRLARRGFTSRTSPCG
ncbi:MAG: TIGR02206 family membrane protein [Verrucomicrobiae bacterium]|nr:TIGR02206 family membrane protein [Verrucomicrobiae bacterium]